MVLVIMGLLQVPELQAEAADWPSLAEVKSWTAKVSLRVENIAAVERSNDTIIVPTSALNLPLTRTEPGNFYVTNQMGEPVLFQVDDLDGDGQADELLVLVSVPAKSVGQYTVYYTQSGRAWPQLLRYTDATDKPAWESQVAAFRSYGPMVLDMFDKPATGRTLALRTIYDHRGRQIFNYHRDNSLVMDILHIGATAGLGGPVLRQHDKTIQPTGLKFESVVVASGPVRSVVRMTLEPWEGPFCRILMMRTASIHAFRPETIVRDEFHVAKLDAPGQLGIGLLKVAGMQTEAAQAPGRLLQWHNQGDDIGPVGLGLLMKEPKQSKVVDDGVNRLLLMSDELQYDQKYTIEFRAFGAWGRGGITGDFAAFQKLAENVAQYAEPLKVIVGSVDKAADASGK